MISEVCGIYFFRSPYHQSNRYLPFVIHAIDPSDPSYPVEVSTVEFKGFTRYEVRTRYSVQAVRNLLLSGKLKDVNRVPRSSVQGTDRILWTLAVSGQELDLRLIQL